MITRYIKTGLGFFLLFFIYFLALFPVLAIRTNLERANFIVALVLWGVLVCICFLPAAAMIIKKVWFFEGKGEPILLDLLQSMLLRVNELDAPISVNKKRKRLVASWRLNDQSWCERFEKKGMKRIYELWLTFDNSTKTVTVSDKYRSANWDLSPITVKTSWLALSKPSLKLNTGDEWGVQNYEDTTAEDYNFVPDEIKSPTVNTILKNGWNVRFSLF